MSVSEYKVVVTDYNWQDLEKEKNILKQVNAKLVPSQCRTEEEVIKTAADADALLNQYAPISERVVANLKKCKVIARYGIGLDNIDVRAATKKRIMVVNVSSYCQEEVSNHALALILACVRKVFYYHSRAKEGSWDWKIGMPILSLNEQTLGIVGFGKIGQRLARKARCLGFRTIAFTPRKHEERYKREGVERVEFGQLLRASDVISLHAPLNERTRHLFGDREFDLMKPSSFIINTARGGLIDEKALYNALADKKIAGAAVDVLETEFPRPDNTLFQLDNLIVTPHVAFYSETSREKLQTKPALDIARALRGETPKGLVNTELIYKKD